MTEKRANEIFRTKYPSGEITRKNASSAGYKYFVVFNEGGKAYYYSATSYQTLLARFGFTILYKHNIDAYKKRIEQLDKIIKDGGEDNKYHMFDKRDFIPFTQEQLSECKNELEELTRMLQTAIIG